ncbi:hypothetical protein [Clavibacter sp. Sh2088]|uniref:restriction endonuclease subunit S n=1 Tax=Clavibacter sp. Sh2088 TaxID=3397676 RepID=UPI0039E103FD
MSTVPLSEIVKPSGSQAGVDINHPVFSVTKHSGFVRSEEYFKKRVHSRELGGYKRVQPGDFAYSTIHLDEGSVGIAPVDGLISPMYTVFAADTTQVVPEYLIRFLKSPVALVQYGRLAKGSVHRRRSISLDTLGTLQVPLPSLDEQRRIAAVLERADELRVRLRRVLAHLDSLAQALFAQKVDLPSASTARIPLSELAVLITKGTTPSSMGLGLAPEGVPFLRAQSLQGGTVKVGSDALFIDAAAHAELKRSIVRGGDILITIAGTIGRVAVVPKDAGEMNCNQAIAIVRLEDTEIGPWVAAWLRSPDAVRQIANFSVTATVANLSLARLGRLEVPVMGRNTQIEFARQLEEINFRRHDAQIAMTAGDELFAALQYQAFRGEL